VTKGRRFLIMFENSGMNYFIGEWDFKSIGNDVERISIFFSMLGVTDNNDACYDEWQQLINLYAPVNCAKKGDNAVADLIPLAAD